MEKQPSPDESLKIYHGSEAAKRLPESKLRESMTELFGNLREAPKSYIEQTREFAKDLLDAIYGQMVKSPVLDGMKRHYHALRIVLFPRSTHREHSQNITRTAREMKEKESLVVATVDGETAGMGGHFLAGKMPGPDGRDVYEMGRVVVLPKFRNRGIFRKVAEGIVRDISLKDSTAPVLVETKNEHVARWCQEKGFEDIGFGQFLRISGVAERDIWAIDQQHGRTLKEEGWNFYLFDPTKEG